MLGGKAATLAASAVLLSATVAFANCAKIPNASSYADGTWLFQHQGVWKPISELTEVATSLVNRNVSFAYIVREVDTVREGLLIVKTGVRLDGPRSSSVTLYRSYSRSSASSCPASYRAFPDGPEPSVKGRSYDEYHDNGRDVEEEDQTKLKAFHVTYRGRGGECRVSDSVNVDSFFAGRKQSNRAQFSFNEQIVSSGRNIPIFALFGVTPAYAASDLSERRVAIAHYASNDSALACVIFNSTLKRGSFIRLVDLDQRIQGIYRTPEVSWNWPR